MFQQLCTCCESPSSFLRDGLQPRIGCKAHEQSSSERKAKVPAGVHKVPAGLGARVGDRPEMVCLARGMGRFGLCGEEV